MHLPRTCDPYTNAGLTTVVSCPLIFTFIFLSHNTPDTLFQFFHPLCTLWVTSESSSPSSVINVDPRYANVFTLFTVSPNKWISASLCLLHPKYSVFFQLHGLQSSLLHCSSPFNKLPFYMLSSSTAQHYCIPSANSILIPRGLLFVAPSHHTQYHVKQVGAQCGSFT